MNCTVRVGNWLSESTGSPQTGREPCLEQGMHLSSVAPGLPSHHDPFLSMGAHAPSAEEPHMHTTQVLYRWEVTRPPKGLGTETR